MLVWRVLSNIRCDRKRDPESEDGRDAIAKISNYLPNGGAAARGAATKHTSGNMRVAPERRHAGSMRCGSSSWAGEG
jgi:hypothetical protein